MPRVVEGLRLHTFHWLVPPMPISYTKQRTYCDEWQPSTALRVPTVRIWTPSWKLGQGLTFSETQEPLELSETHGPMAPQTFSSLDVYKQRKRRDIKSTLTTAFIKFAVNIFRLTVQQVMTLITTPKIISLPWLPGHPRRPCGSLRCSLY